MRFRFFLISIAFIPFLSFTLMHKYYVSVTQIDYIKKEKSIQITSRIFIDDFENMLKERYDDSIILEEGEDTAAVDLYIRRYLDEKIKIKINGEDINFTFIGKAYDHNIMRCYMEIKDVESVSTIGVTNQVLFDLYTEQQNLIKLNVNSKQKSCLLSFRNDKALLDF